LPSLSAIGRQLISSGDRDGAEDSWDELDGVASESRDAMSRPVALTSVAFRAFLHGRLEYCALHSEPGDTPEIAGEATILTRT